MNKIYRTFVFFLLASISALASADWYTVDLYDFRPGHSGFGFQTMWVYGIKANNVEDDSPFFTARVPLKEGDVIHSMQCQVYDNMTVDHLGNEKNVSVYLAQHSVNEANADVSETIFTLESEGTPGFTTLKSQPTNFVVKKSVDFSNSDGNGDTYSTLLIHAFLTPSNASLPTGQYMSVKACGIEYTPAAQVSNTPEIEPFSTLRIQENTPGFVAVDGIIESNRSGFTGTGFANTDNANNKGIHYSLAVPKNGNYLVKFRFAHVGSFRSASLQLDGGIRGSYAFNETGSWDNWVDSNSINVYIEAGTHKISLISTNNAGLPNIDYVEITAQ